MIFRGARARLPYPLTLFVVLVCNGLLHLAWFQEEDPATKLMQSNEGE